jgi:hypothetical protein
MLPKFLASLLPGMNPDFAGHCYMPGLLCLRVSGEEDMTQGHWTLSHDYDHPTQDVETHSSCPGKEKEERSHGKPSVSRIALPHPRGPYLSRRALCCTSCEWFAVDSVQGQGGGSSDKCNWSVISVSVVSAQFKCLDTYSTGRLCLYRLKARRKPGSVQSTLDSYPPLRRHICKSSSHSVSTYSKT